MVIISDDILAFAILSGIAFMAYLGVLIAWALVDFIFRFFDRMAR